MSFLGPYYFCVYLLAGSPIVFSSSGKLYGMVTQEGCYCMTHAVKALSARAFSTGRFKITEEQESKADVCEKGHKP